MFFDVCRLSFISSSLIMLNILCFCMFLHSYVLVFVHHLFKPCNKKKKCETGFSVRIYKNKIKLLEELQ